FFFNDPSTPDIYTLSLHDALPICNVALKYNLLPWLFVQGRFGQDYWSRDEDVNNFPTGQASRPAAATGFFNGIYTQESRRFRETDRKSTRLNSSHVAISYAVYCLK